MTIENTTNEGVVTPTPPNIKNTFFDDVDNKEIYVKIKSAGDNNITIERLGDDCSNLSEPTVFFQNKKMTVTDKDLSGGNNTIGGKKQKSKHSKQTKKSNKSRKAKKSKQSRKVHRK